MRTLIELFDEEARGCIEGQRNTLSCYAPKPQGSSWRYVATTCCFQLMEAAQNGLPRLF